MRGDTEQKQDCFAWYVCFGSFIINFVIGGFMSCGGMVLSALVDNYQVDRAEAAWVSSLAASSIYVFAPLSTYLCGRVGSRATVGLGIIVCCTSFIASSFATSIKVLYFTYSICWGLGASLCYYPNFLMIARYFKSKISLANGISISGSSFGTMVMSPVLGQLFTHLNMANTFRVLLCFHVLLVIPVCLFRPPQPIEERAKKSSTKCLDGKVLRNSRYWVWVTAMFIFQLNYMVPYIHLIRLGEDLGASKTIASLLITILAGSSLIGRVLLGRFADLPCCNRLYICQIALLSIGVSTTLVSCATSYAWVALYASVFGLNEGAYMTVVMVITKDIVGPVYLPFALGVMYLLLSIPKTVGPLIAGFMFDRSHSYTTPFMIMGGLTVLSSMMLSLIPYNNPNKITRTRERIRETRV